MQTTTAGSEAGPPRAEPVRNVTLQFAEKDSAAVLSEIQKLVENPALRKKVRVNPPVEPAMEFVTKADSSMAGNWRWAFAARNAGELNAYAGQHVVVVGQRVLAADREVSLAIKQAASLTDVPEHDFAVLYVDEPGAEGWLDVR